LINSKSATIYYLGEYEYLVDVPFELPAIEIQSSYEVDGIITVEAWDPLPDYEVNRVEAMINGTPAVCDNYNGKIEDGRLICDFPFYNFPVSFTGYATSTFGDQSRNIELRIGKAFQSDTIFSDPEKKVVIIGDVAYTQYNLYHDVPRVWGVLPGNAIVPGWLKTDSPVELISDHTYYYLAGQILLNGVVDAPNCWNNGINGQYGTNCGVLSVSNKLYEYQNAYNDEIYLASQQTGIPSRLIKRIIAIESQFYPDALGIAGERGLYQLTRDGADTLLRWNGPFYVEVCGEYFDNCGELGYDNLDDWQRDVLQNHILSDPNNIYYLGSTLKANAFQIVRLLDNVLKIDDPGEYFTYSELWKLAVCNYHAGATITTAVFVHMLEADKTISWESFATSLEHLQPSALEYVNRVYRNY